MSIARPYLDHNELFLSHGNALFFGPNDGVLLARRDPAEDGKRNAVGRLVLTPALAPGIKIFGKTALIAAATLQGTDAGVRRVITELEKSSDKQTGEKAFSQFEKLDTSRAASESDDSILEPGDIYYLRGPLYHAFILSRFLHPRRDTNVTKPCVALRFLTSRRLRRCNRGELLGMLQGIANAGEAQGNNRTWAAAMIQLLESGDPDAPGAARNLFDIVQREQLPQHLGITQNQQRAGWIPSSARIFCA